MDAEHATNGDGKANAGPDDQALSAALDLYVRYRFGDQRSWFEQRASEFRRADRQAHRVAAALLVLAGVASSVATAQLWGDGRGWAVAATALAALATAVGGFATAWQFEPLARQYRRTGHALGLLEAERPDERCLAVNADSVRTFVTDVERVLLSEIDQWSRITLHVVDVEADGQNQAASSGERDRSAETAGSRDR